MSNTLSPYTPQFWSAFTLQTLTTQNVLASLIHRDFEDTPQNVGDTVHTRKPGTFVVNDKTPGSNTTVQDATATDIQVVLNKHKEVTFVVSDREMATSLPNLIETLIVPAGQAMSQQMDKDIFDVMAKNFFYSVGTAGTTPSTLSALALVRQKQNKKMVPFNGRQLVIGTDAEAKFVVLDAFINKNYIGQVNEDNVALKEAQLGRKLGLDIFMDQNIDATTTQAAATAYVANGINAKGSSSLIVKTGTGIIQAGALVTVTSSGITDEYVVPAGAVSGAATWTVVPPLRRATADGDVIVVVCTATTYVKNPFFTKNAVGLITRPLPNPQEMGAGVMSSVMSLDGFSVRATMSYDAALLSWRFTLDCLYGLALLDGELGGILLG